MLCADGVKGQQTKPRILQSPKQCLQSAFYLLYSGSAVVLQWLYSNFFSGFTVVMQWVYSWFAVAVRVHLQLQWMEGAYRFMTGDANNIAMILVEEGAGEGQSIQVKTTPLPMLQVQRPSAVFLAKSEGSPYTQWQRTCIQSLEGPRSEGRIR